MISEYGEYYTMMNMKLRHVQVYRHNSHRSINLTFSSQTTMAEITEALLGRLFSNIPRLRLFNDEGMEVFGEDLPFIKEESILYASANGEEFDQTVNFKEYKILKVLGEGGFGKVMLGKHKITHQKVAIKILNTSIVGNAEDIDTVFREAQLLQSLNHRNIVKIFKCYTLANMKVVFVMEYLEGGELLQLVEGIQHLQLNADKGRLEEDEAKGYLRQIVDAINYCHTQSVIHRDLKLENVLLQSRGGKEVEVSKIEFFKQVKVVDFGISGISTFSVDKIDSGSLLYMAPEVLGGKLKKIQPSIDVWAIGVMLYAMLCGTLPFQGESSADIVNAIMLANPVYPENLSSLSKHLLSKMLCPDPQRRIKLIDVARHPWLLKAIIREQQREQEAFAKRDSVLKSGQNIATNLELIRLYGGTTSLRSGITKSKPAIKPLQMSIVDQKLEQQPQSPATRLSTLGAIIEDEAELKKINYSMIHEQVKNHTYRPKEKIITKRYSRILQIYQPANSLSPKAKSNERPNYTNSYGASFPKLNNQLLQFNKNRALKGATSIRLNESSSLPKLK